MLKPRIIPFLLIQNNGLIKTVQFKNEKYLGDPINAVRIFNEKKADEIIIIDKDPTLKNLEPNFRLISNLAEECQMPMTYGGGINSVDQAEKIFTLGVEKISLSSGYFSNKNLVNKLVDLVVSQSIAITLDVKKSFLGKYEIFTHGGKIKVKEKLENVIKEIQMRGAGEIIINNISKDGMMNGYDISLLELIKPLIKVPLTFLGGASNVDDFKTIISKHPIIGLSAGSFFVFKGKLKAVLISYPKENILDFE